eukprot:EG_transcript_22276
MALRYTTTLPPPTLRGGCASAAMVPTLTLADPAEGPRWTSPSPRRASARWGLLAAVLHGSARWLLNRPIKVHCDSIWWSAGGWVAGPKFSCILTVAVPFGNLGRPPNGHCRVVPYCVSSRCVVCSTHCCSRIFCFAADVCFVCIKLLLLFHCGRLAF